MTTSETFGSYPPPPPAAPRSRLRRSRTGRVGAGVAAGLGEYFGLDPVLFRVLFATSAFFGGAGILAYLIAWAAIPEQGTESAPIDGWVGELRRRRIPIWVVAVVGGLFLWVVAFSWWAPGPFFPVIAVVVLLVVFFGRRDLQNAAPPVSEPVSLTKDGDPAPATDQPTWVRDTRAWFDESRRARRERRRRALPVKVATLTTLGGTLITLGIIDSITGIDIQTYFWFSLAIVVSGLLVGAIARRTPWSVASLLPPIVIGTVALAGSHAQFSDGFGQRDWTPTTAPAATYRLAFGQGILDLRSLPRQDVPRHIDVTVGSGQVQILASKALNLTVRANIHIGQLDVDNTAVGGHHGHGGVGITRTVAPLAGAKGERVTVDVHLADGQIRVERS